MTMTPRSPLLPRFLVALSCLGCGGASEAVPPPECAGAWAAEDARAFVDTLERATRSERPVWGDYALADGAYVLDAGAPTPEGDGGTAADGACLGLWRAGRAIGYALVSERPSLLTPLYGYYFDANWHGGPDEPYLERAAQPAAVRAWLEKHEVESAVVLPVTVPDFPIEMSALVKTQLAVHEGFHVRVQAPRWFASTGDWPVWDEQPDRAGVSACYAATDEVAAAAESERATLVRLVESLLDGERAGACEAGTEFLGRREARYDLLSDVAAAPGDAAGEGAPGDAAEGDGAPESCRRAEAVMELEEGTADYASWTVLYDLELAGRDRLLGHYRAVQDELFYLTGAMQLHALQLMARDAMSEITRRIATSTGPESGSITHLLGRTLDSHCEG